MFQSLHNHALFCHEFSSSRLLSFVVPLCRRLQLDSNDAHWNALQLCARDGFFVAVSPTRSHNVRCFACAFVAFATLDEFAVAVQQYSPTAVVVSFVSLDSPFLRLPHERSCNRQQTSRDDLSFCDVLALKSLVRETLSFHDQLDIHDQYLCRVCLSRASDVVCLPCGHVYACFDCLALGVRQTHSRACFVCRGEVRAVQQLYYA